jgi:hypothetical protein
MVVFTGFAIGLKQEVQDKLVAGVQLITGVLAFEVKVMD